MTGRTESDDEEDVSVNDELQCLHPACYCCMPNMVVIGLHGCYRFGVSQSMKVLPFLGKLVSAEKTCTVSAPPPPPPPTLYLVY